MLNPVVQAHLEAVQSGDPEAMAAFFDDGAVIERGVQRYVGRDEIEQYFESVSEHMAGGKLVFGGTNALTVRWKIVGGPADGVAGTDVFAVQDGRIVFQRITLQGRDF